MEKYRNYREYQTLKEKYPSFSPFVLLKLSMILSGAVLTQSALEHLQTPEYSFGEAEPFQIGFVGREKKISLPGAVLLRDSTFVYINWGESYEHPYEIRYCDGVFLLCEDDLVIDEIDFVRRPAFFGKRTSSGVLMDSLADVRAQKLILTAFQKCLFWKDHEQCHYCAFFTNQKSTGLVSEDDLFETVQEALKEEGRFCEIYLSGGSDYTGSYPFENEIERYIRILSRISGLFKERFPSQLMAPAYEKKDLKRIFDNTGITSYCPNIEIWDRDLFENLCPGKQRHIGYDNWIRRTIDAVEVFGKGNVYTQVVAGAELARPHGFDSEDEALESNLEGCEFFAKNGVICLSTIWRPHKFARLGYQKMPSLEYYVRLSQGFHDIRRAYGLVSVDDDYKRCGNHPDSDLERTDAL